MLFFLLFVTVLKRKRIFNIFFVLTRLAFNKFKLRILRIARQKSHVKSVNWLTGRLTFMNNFNIHINYLIRLRLIKTVFMCCLFIISVVLRLFFWYFSFEPITLHVELMLNKRGTEERKERESEKKVVN